MGSFISNREINSLAYGEVSRPSSSMLASRVPSAAGGVRSYAPQSRVPSAAPLRSGSLPPRLPSALPSSGLQPQPVEMEMAAEAADAAPQSGKEGKASDGSTLSPTRQGQGLKFERPLTGRIMGDRQQGPAPQQVPPATGQRPLTGTIFADLAERVSWGSKPSTPLAENPSDGNSKVFGDARLCQPAASHPSSVSHAQGAASASATALALCTPNFRTPSLAAASAADGGVPSPSAASAHTRAADEPSERAAGQLGQPSERHRPSHRSVLDGLDGAQRSGPSQLGGSRSRPSVRPEALLSSPAGGFAGVGQGIEPSASNQDQWLDPSDGSHAVPSYLHQGISDPVLQQVLKERWQSMVMQQEEAAVKGAPVLELGSRLPKGSGMFPGRTLKLPSPGSGAEAGASRPLPPNESSGGSPAKSSDAAASSKGKTNNSSSGSSGQPPSLGVEGSQFSTAKQRGLASEASFSNKSKNNSRKGIGGGGGSDLFLGVGGTQISAVKVPEGRSLDGEPSSSRLHGESSSTSIGSGRGMSNGRGGAGSTGDKLPFGVDYSLHRSPNRRPRKAGSGILEGSNGTPSGRANFVSTFGPQGGSPLNSPSGRGQRPASPRPPSASPRPPSSGRSTASSGARKLALLVHLAERVIHPSVSGVLLLLAGEDAASSPLAGKELRDVLSKPAGKGPAKKSQPAKASAAAQTAAARPTAGLFTTAPDVSMPKSWGASAVKLAAAAGLHLDDYGRAGMWASQGITMRHGVSSTAATAVTIPSPAPTPKSILTSVTTQAILASKNSFEGETK